MGNMLLTPEETPKAWQLYYLKKFGDAQLLHC